MRFPHATSRWPVGSSIVRYTCRTSPVCGSITWPKEDELTAVGQQIAETTDAYKARRITGGRYFQLLEDLEAEERQLKAEKRRYEAERQERKITIPNVAAEWNRPDFTLVRQSENVIRADSDRLVT